MGSMHTGLEGHSLPRFLENWIMNSNSSGDNDGAPAAVMGEDDHSLERMAKYFQTRAEGGVGLMVTGTYERTSSILIVLIGGRSGEYMMLVLIICLSFSCS